MATKKQQLELLMIQLSRRAATRNGEYNKKAAARQPKPTVIWRV